MRAMSDALWPVRGLWCFLSHPQWWGRPVLAMLVALALLLAAATAVGWWWWPTVEVTGWSWWWQMARALGFGGVAALLTWMLAVPLVMAVALESLARAAQLRAGVTTVADPPIAAAVLASLRVVANTLHIRLGCVLLALLGAFLGPLGLVLSALAMGLTASIDALDTGLAVRGLAGLERVRAIQAHSGELWQGAIVAGMLNLVLLPTGIGWLVWLPGLVTGAAEQVLGWSEVSPPTALKTVEATVIPSPPSI